MKDRFAPRLRWWQSAVPFHRQRRRRIKDLASHVEECGKTSCSAMASSSASTAPGDTPNNTPFTKQSTYRPCWNGLASAFAASNSPCRPALPPSPSACLLPPFATRGHADRRDHFRPWATPRPGRRYAVGDAASWRRWQCRLPSRKASLAIGSFTAEGQAAKITRGVPTVGRMPNGAIIEHEINSRSTASASCTALPAQIPTSPDGQAHRDHRSTTISARRSPNRSTASTVRSHAAEEISWKNVVAMLTGEIEQLQVEAGLRRQDRHRRTLGRHRHRPRRCRVSTVAIARQQSSPPSRSRRRRK